MGTDGPVVQTHELTKKYQDRHPYLNELRRHPSMRQAAGSLAREVHGHRPWTRDRERARSREAARGLYL